MEMLERTLAEHPFLAELEDHFKVMIAECASYVEFEGGQFIFREGEVAGPFYLISQGKVALEMFSPRRGSIIIETLGPGEVLGYTSLVAPFRRHFDARAVEVTRTIAIEGGCLQKQCEKDDTLCHEVLKRIVPIIESRLRATRFQLLDLYGSH